MQGAVDSVTGQGPLYAFMLICLFVLCGAIIVLWKRLMKQDDDQNKAQTDTLVVLKGIENVLAAINRELERRRDG